MSILVLNSSRGKNIPYDAWLSDSSQKIYFLCSDEQNITHHPYEVAESFSNYEVSDQVIARAIAFIQEKKIDTIIAKSECDLLRAGKLRDQFQLKGQSYEQALAFRDKVVMKSYLEKNQIAVPRHKRLLNQTDAILFSQEYGFPLVLKPVDGAGSLNTFVLHNEEDLKALPADLFSKNMEIEEFIEGEMYHIDGIVLENQVRFIYPSRYVTSCLGYRDNQSTGGHVLSPNNPLCARLITFVKKVLAALPTPAFTTFHAEVFHTKNDNLVFCEIASRTGGGRIARSLQVSFDIDLDKLWIQSQVKIRDWQNQSFQNVPNVLSGWILIPPQKGTLVGYPEDALPEWVVEYQQFGALGKKYDAPQKSSDCIASFVVVGGNEQEVTERLFQIEDWFKSRVIWKN